MGTFGRGVMLTDAVLCAGDRELRGLPEYPFTPILSRRLRSSRLSIDMTVWLCELKRNEGVSSC